MSTPVTPPSADPTDWRLVLDAIQFFLYVVLGIYLWIVNKNKVTNDRIKQVEKATATRIGELESDMDKRLDAHGDRLTRTEERMSHLPTRESIGKLHARLDQVQQDQSETKGELKGMHKTLDLIHKHMMEADK